MNKGFAVMDLLIILAIVGILAAVAIPGYIAIRASENQEESPLVRQKTKTQVDYKYLAIKQCLQLDGIPLLNKYGRLTRCQFKP